MLKFVEIWCKNSKGTGVIVLWESIKLSKRNNSN